MKKQFVTAEGNTSYDWDYDGTLEKDSYLLYSITATLIV